MIRNLFCIVVAAVWTTIGFFACLFLMMCTFRASTSLWWVKRVWSPVLLWAGGAQLEVLGLDNVDLKQPFIYVSNHQSTIDIPVLFVAIPVPFRFAAKKALQYVPFLGWYLKLAGFPMIDRHNHRDAVETLDRAGAQIRSGSSIVMFPEGTRSRDGVVLPFKKGPFSLAMRAAVPIVPVTIHGAGTLMPKNSWTITPGPIRVRLGRPIDPVAFKDDRDALIRAVRSIIIRQSLELGGAGGDPTAAVAARGHLGTSVERLADAPQEPM
jgi:1-acyl-sn-glycerol-3-phosphate acyltransferase